MPSYKVILPDKTELSFSDEKNSFIEASQKASSLNRILVVKQQEQEGRWVECATVFPNGEIRRPVNISSFADNLPLRKNRSSAIKL